MAKKIARYRLPDGAAALDSLATSVLKYAMVPIEMGKPHWADVPAASWTAFQDAYTAWTPAYAACKVAHLPKDTEAKNLAETALRDALSDLLDRGFLLPPRTAEDVVAMGFALRDTTHTAHPVPSLKPETLAEPTGKEKHTVTAIHPVEKTKKKPPLVKGVAFASRIRTAGEPPATTDTMPSVFQTGTSRAFQWNEADHGKVADYATAYENDSGDRGPWSDVVSALIA
jgi:hypothetical protein